MFTMSSSDDFLVLHDLNVVVVVIFVLAYWHFSARHLMISHLSFSATSVCSEPIDS